MPIVIRLQDIDEAIENLHYKSETTLKAKLVRAVRQYYTDDSSSESLAAIDTEELVKTIWETGEDRDLLKAKRKNLSSVKSSVNTDLKKLYAEGKNPQGLVISQSNTFTISDEAKDKALTGIMDVFQDMGIDTQSKISKILTALSDVLAGAAATDTAIESTKEEIDRLKTVMSGITDKLGLSLEDLVGQAEAIRKDRQATAADALPDVQKEKGPALADYIQDDISAIDKGLARLAREAVEAAADAQSDVREALSRAFADIVDIIRDQETESAAKAQKILTAVEQMVGKAIDASGQELSGDQAGQLKQIFHDMSRTAEETAAGAGTAAPLPVAEAPLPGDPLHSRVADILGDATGSPGDKIGRIMAAVNDMIGEALANSGLSGEEIAGLKDMMGNITANLEAFAEGALSEEEIIEEIIEEEAESVEVAEEPAKEATPAEEAAGEEIISEEAPAVSEDEVVEIIEEVAGDGIETAPPAEDAAITETGAEEIIEVAQGEAPPAAEGEIVEVIEEVIGEEELPPGEVPVEAGADGEGAEAASPAEGEIIEVVEEIVGAEDLPAAEEAPVTEAEGEMVEVPAEPPPEEAGAEGETGPGEGTEATSPEEGEIIEVVEEIVENEAAQTGLESVSAEEMAGNTEDLASVETLDAAESEAVGELEEAAPGDLVEEVAAEAATVTDDVIVVEEVVDEAALQTAEGLPAEAAVAEVMEEPAAETVEMDESELAALQDVSGEIPPAEEAAAPEAGGEIVEEISDADLVEEIVEDQGGESPAVEVRPSDQPLDEDLREKTELLSRLAEAAGVLEKLGPDLSGSIYTEDELRSKAKFLSEEFDRYLSIRDKFYNSHILIKSGDFLVGGAHLTKSELAEQIVTLPDFYIGKFPVTNALFEIFVEQTGYITTAEKFGYGLVYYPRMQRSRDPITGIERFSLHSQAYYKRVTGACWYRPTGPDSALHLKRTHPVVQVSLEDARAFASWTGKRLPTEIEWEAAARTARGNIYPWGNQWLDDACNIEKSLHGDTTSVDRYVKFANALEVADMLGNVLEWTMDAIGDQETSETYIAKGASWISHGDVSLTDRHYIEKTTSSNILGFRCIAI